MSPSTWLNPSSVMSSSFPITHRPVKTNYRCWFSNHINISFSSFPEKKFIRNRFRCPFLIYFPEILHKKFDKNFQFWIYFQKDISLLKNLQSRAGIKMSGRNSWRDLDKLFGRLIAFQISFKNISISFIFCWNIC